MIGGLISATAFGQSTLPTAWNFDDPQPTGWTEHLDEFVNGTRYTNGLVDAACKLDADDEFVQVHFSDVCGGVTYYIKAQGSASGDVFSIQESVDGNTWTDLRVLNDAEITAASSAFVEYTDEPAAASRYLRWFFTEKQSGRNIALDEVSLIAQVPTDAAEIGVNVAGESVVSGSTYVVGNSASTTFTIENVNLPTGNDLNITDMQISGPNAAEFMVSNISIPAAVGAASSLDFDILFSTIEQGTRNATLVISNDDANGDETEFTIDLIGIGGNLATEPTAQATDLSFSDVTTYGYDVSFQAGSPAAEKYLVLRGVADVAFLALPQDGETYVKGDYLDPVTQVVHVGDPTTFRPKHVLASADYQFVVYAFNGPAGYENYLIGQPLMGSVSTPETMVGNYYDGIDASAATFLGDLQNRVDQPYHQIFYSEYGPVMIEKFASRDTTNGQSVVTGAYAGFQYVYQGAFFYDPVGLLSREHSWPHSWMPTWPLQDGPEYSDIHNLFPVHQDNANVVRSNRPLGEVVNPVSSFLNAQYGHDVHGNLVYEPRDQHKGDVARTIFYMAMKWNGANGTWELPDPISSSVQYGQDQDVLKQWHWQDPPDAWEIARNDFIESEQGNRNPFVDNVDWVCYIDFADLSYIGEQTGTGPCAVTSNGTDEQLVGDFSISPNPTEGNAVLSWHLTESQQLSINVLDISGRTVSTRTGDFNAGTSREMIDLTKLEAGIYHVVLLGESERRALKVVLQ